MLKIRKLWVSILIVVGGLIFYSVGIATDLFAYPAFSMFFVISYETAHNVALYAAAGTAIVLAITATAINLIKKPKTIPQQTQNIVVHSTEKSNQTPTPVTSSQTNQITVSTQKENKEEKNQSLQQPTNQTRLPWLPGKTQ